MQQIPKVLNFKGIIMPQKLITSLKYHATPLLFQAASDTASRQFRVNGLYDTDPALASTAISGFAELMAIYRSYRVKRAKLSVEFINLDANPTLCNVGLETTFFTANTKNYPYFGGTFQKDRLIAYNLGGAPVKLEIAANLQDIVGDAASLADDDYTGTLTTNPVGLVYGSVAISDPRAVAMTNGAYARIEITYGVEFFNVRNLNA